MPTTTSSAKTHVAKRGTQWLTRDELEAHLASLLRIEHAAVFLGSGSSLDIGGRTMRAAWQSFKADFPKSHDWLQTQGFVESGKEPNLEALLDSVEICRSEWTRSKHSELPHVEDARADLRRSLIGAATLKREWWTGIPDSDLPLLKSHRALLQKFCGARQPGQAAPWVFTSNYDLAIEWAAESLGLACINGFSGLHQRRFSPHNFDLGLRNVLARGEARFGTYCFYLAKLHGSLSWHSKDGAEEVAERAASSIWPELADFLDGKSNELAGVMALPGASKYQTTVGFVMGELFRRFTDFMARPQAALFVNGYSFSDAHLNRLLVTALQNPTLQMVVYSPSSSKTSDALLVPVDRKWLRDIAALELPQLTIVFGTSDGTFKGMVSHLPDPAIYDEQAAHIRKMLQEIKGSASA